MSRFPFWLHHAPRLAVLMHDLGMVCLSWVGIQFLFRRFVETPLPASQTAIHVLVVLLVQGVVLWRCGLYQGLWRFASMADLANIVRAVLLGTGAIVFCLAWRRFEGIALPALALYPVALSFLLGIPRLMYRAWSDYRLQRTSDECQRVLILGAGLSGSDLIRELRRMGDYRPIGLLDDARHLLGTRLQGVPVLGTLDKLPQVARETAATLLVIAIPTLDKPGFHRVIALCEQTGLPYRIAPKLDDVLSGRHVALKEVAIEDLLGRNPVEPDWGRIQKWLQGRTVLVTGAGGSIGAELCRLCAANGVGRLILIDQAELSLLRIEQEIRHMQPRLALKVVLGDCGDRSVIDHALTGWQVDALFHAAAYKHVPVLEGQVREAIRNNVLATYTVGQAAIAAGVSHFVLISTDKAVNPVNALGASKRCAEMVCQALGEGQDQTRFVVVRFGNVLDSAGSVVPVFREQIARGGPVTVTDPEVTRYFMTIPESCQLILQAVSSATHGAVFTLDMGESVQIARLAEQMIRLAGKIPGRDITIVYTGLRPGEKLHETLFYADEAHMPTAHPKVMEAAWRPLAREAVLDGIRKMEESVRRYDPDALRRQLGELVTDYGRVQHAVERDGQRASGGKVISLARWMARTGEGS